MHIWRVCNPDTIQWASAILDPAELDFIESEIDASKTKQTSGKWDPWIKAPFDFPLPIGAKFGARFTQPGSMRNALYAGYEPKTAIFETAWHFLRFRKASSAALNSRHEIRRIFSIGFDDSDAIDIRRLESHELKRILDPFDYSASQAFAARHSKAPSIVSPSVRHESGLCAAVFDITKLEKEASNMRDLSYALTEDKEAVIVQTNLDELNSVLTQSSLGCMVPRFP